MPVSSRLRSLPTLALIAVVGAGCAPWPPARGDEAPPAPPAVALAPAQAPAAPAIALPPPPAPAPAASSAVPIAAAEPLGAADVAARRLLRFHDRLRGLPPAEVAAETARLASMLGNSAPGSAPGVALELSIALAQSRNVPDVVRALGLAEAVARADTPEAADWRSLARLLAARLAEQRRAEEQLERQSAQLRESQRSVQQLNEKLEALKAIERSLNPRPAANPAPATRLP